MGERNPLVEVVDIAPTHQQRILDAGLRAAPGHNLPLRHRDKCAIVDRRRFRNNRGARHIFFPLIEWLERGRSWSQSLLRAGDQDFAPVIQRPIVRSDCRSRSWRHGVTRTVTTRSIGSRTVSGSSCNRAIAVTVDEMRVAPIQRAGGRRGGWTASNDGEVARIHQ